MVKEKIRESSEGTLRRMETDKELPPAEQRPQTDDAGARVPPGFRREDPGKAGMGTWGGE